MIAVALQKVMTQNEILKEERGGIQADLNLSIKESIQMPSLMISPFQTANNTGPSTLSNQNLPSSDPNSNILIHRTVGQPEGIKTGGMETHVFSPDSVGQDGVEVLVNTEQVNFIDTSGEIQTNHHLMTSDAVYSSNTIGTRAVNGKPSVATNLQSKKFSNIDLAEELKYEDRMESAGIQGWQQQKRDS